MLKRCYLQHFVNKERNTEHGCRFLSRNIPMAILSNRAGRVPGAGADSFGLIRNLCTAKAGSSCLLQSPVVRTWLILCASHSTHRDQMGAEDNHFGKRFWSGCDGQCLWSALQGLESSWISAQHVRAFLDYAKGGEKTHSKCEWHYPWIWGLRLDGKRE